MSYRGPPREKGQEYVGLNRQPRGQRGLCCHDIRRQVASVVQVALAVGGNARALAGPLTIVLIPERMVNGSDITYVENLL